MRAATRNAIEVAAAFEEISVSHGVVSLSEERMPETSDGSSSVNNRQRSDSKPPGYLPLDSKRPFMV
ncbi:hypothetical protein AM571_CH02782 [Rhizobium etli 8C-3]|uniref:Uncharacterized protein n=1 Tax=Rhizobium etli 8C-3 TaxID=538025 RepID=A0A1L5P612_RHIET|nr:hypothetical protein AM571_CH02782 [Rhizobium etli 8C-3]